MDFRTNRKKNGDFQLMGRKTWHFQEIQHKYKVKKETYKNNLIL